MGIHAGYTLDGDHLPVICDLHINSAGLAPRPVLTWQPHTCSKLKFHPDITTKMTGDFSGLFRHLNNAQEPLNPTQTHPQTPTQTLLQHLRQAAAQTVAETNTLEYPRPFKPIRYQDGWGYKLSTWNRHLRGATRAILHPRIARQAAITSLNRAKWPHPSQPEDLAIGGLSNLTSLYDRGLVIYIVIRVRAQLRRNEL